jgi:hypothetical protein
MVDAVFSPASFTTSPPVGVMSISETAGTVDTVVKNVMRVEPMLAGMAGMFIPGLSLVQPWIVMMAPYLERALDDLSKNNNGDVLSAFLELIQHVIPGQPNSTVLGLPAPAATATDGLDPTQQPGASTAG